MRTKFAALAALTMMVLSFAAPAHAYLDVSPRSIYFFDQPVGSMSHTEYVYVYNRYAEPIDVRVRDNCYSDFIVNDGCWSALPPGSSCTIRVQFWPASEGSKWCTIDVQDSFYGWATVNVQGRATPRR